MLVHTCALHVHVEVQGYIFSLLGIEPKSSHSYISAVPLSPFLSPLYFTIMITFEDRVLCTPL